MSAEPTLLAFYERLLPFASAFMALFGRSKLPHRSTLSRYLAALDQPTVEALRSLFLDDLIRRTAQPFPSGGLWDRQGHHWLVADVDGTKQAARQRALPSRRELPAAHRRFERVCAPGYLGRKRGEVARSRTTVLQAHSHQWLGTFSGAGNGAYQAELTRACETIISYAGWLCLPLDHILIRLDGLYGTMAVLAPLLSSGLGVIVRSKAYGLLDLPAVAARLRQPPDAQTTHPESGAQRALFDCPSLTLCPSGPPVRLIVATHPATSIAKPPIGVLRDGTVYELFLTTAPQAAFTCTDVLDLYLHRGSFETVLSDEDQEQSTDRWCSHSACGQEFWQVLNQWLWNLRLDLGQHLSASALRLTEFAPAVEPPSTPPSQPPGEPVPHEPPGEPPAVPANASVHYGPPHWARRSFTKGFAGSDFVPQPDGTLRCPAGHPLTVHERRPERHGSLRIVYGARITHCRPCPLRAQCLESTTTRKPRQVSAVLRPIDASPSAPVPSPAPRGEVPIEHERIPLLPSAATLHPVLWGDWPRCQLRRSWIRLLRTQTVELTVRDLQEEDLCASHNTVQTRAERAHWRLSWQQRLARNARSASAPPVEITIYGLPVALAAYVGVNQVTAA
ncbi:hypothetical protein KDI_55790 [Dictyobacter arantiisoli]|uniref:Transposase DDE domain-containing protein n=1 Tax=Dictyobacter arantiisoli TaxID=2014874 RepID=A0A5A5TL17_9CHLR|nr:hypothetical protein KDI_55790 [Dictyobacter arantiisoli]